MWGCGVGGAGRLAVWALGFSGAFGSAQGVADVLLAVCAYAALAFAPCVLSPNARRTRARRTRAQKFNCNLFPLVISLHTPLHTPTLPATATTALWASSWGWPRSRALCCGRCRRPAGQAACLRSWTSRCGVRAQGAGRGCGTAVVAATRVPHGRTFPLPCDATS